MSFILIAIAAIFNAIMDTLWTHYPISVFKNLNPKWWNPNESWKHYPNFLGIVRFDAWHIAKYGMLCFITLSIYFYKPILGNIDIYLIPIIWGFSFELFYSNLLKTK